MQLRVWRFLDGNRAHEKQSAALVCGLRKSFAGQVQSFDIPAGLTPSRILLGRMEELEQLPKPDFLIGTGRKSRLPMLAARRRFGGRAISINRPQLPFSWFDYAIVPEHDRPPPLENVILSQGALTEPLPENSPQAGRGLVLLGGPSKHYAWDIRAISEQIEPLLNQPIEWQITDSRRTPEGTLDALSGERINLVDWRTCAPGWVQEQMALAGQIWVSEDSVSMLFESLQSRARVGVIRVPGRGKSNKVRAAVQRLIDQDIVSEHLGEVLAQPQRQPLDQYLLCARALLRRCGLPLN
ncbi:ELM1/GtrOC1 family putative glycosyltransferase [uncultured Microbulbifer sp.]|uniref:ELM1/GtrOC1 family putative glycosyltransferase n=1 Tax=uncultured Microbulbifer sp. TaxID=348147 RepID=UPI00261E485A|nr:ELM1/GtrOC1 family putative glycosyltransferase [uncultured Microbulbifer sp.]